RQLCRNNTDLAHASSDDFAFTFPQHLHGAEKLVIELNCTDRLGFYLEHGASTDEIKGRCLCQFILCHKFKDCRCTKNRSPVSTSCPYYCLPACRPFTSAIAMTDSGLPPCRRRDREQSLLFAFQ